MAGLCRDTGVGIIPWNPLARGRLACGNNTGAETERDRTDAFCASSMTRTRRLTGR